MTSKGQKLPPGSRIISASIPDGSLWWDFAKETKIAGHVKNVSSEPFTQIAAQCDPNECVVETIKVPDYTIGFLSGRDGTVFKQLIASSQAEISVSRQSEIPLADGHSIISIQGQHEAVHHAKQCIYDRLCECFRLEAMFTNSDTAQVSSYIGDINFEPSIASRIQPEYSGNLSASSPSFMQFSKDPCALVTPADFPLANFRPTDFRSKYDEHSISMGSTASFQKVEETESAFSDCNRRMRCFRPGVKGPEYFKNDTNTSNNTIPLWLSGNSSASSPSFMQFSEDPCALVTPTGFPLANFPSNDSRSKYDEYSIPSGSTASFQKGTEKKSDFSDYNRETRYFLPAAEGRKHFLDLGKYRSTLVETTYIYISLCDNDFDWRVQWIRRVLGAIVTTRNVRTTVGKERCPMILKEVMITGSAKVQCQSQSTLYQLIPAFIWTEFDIPSIFMPRLIGAQGVKLTKYATLSSAVISIPGSQDMIRVPELDKETGSKQTTLRITGTFLPVQRAQRLVRDYLSDLYDRAKNQDSNKGRSEIKDYDEVKDVKEHGNAKVSALLAANDAVVDDISASLLSTCDDKKERKTIHMEAASDSQGCTNLSPSTTSSDGNDSAISYVDNFGNYCGNSSGNGWNSGSENDWGSVAEHDHGNSSESGCASGSVNGRDSGSGVGQSINDGEVDISEVAVDCCPLLQEN